MVTNFWCYFKTLKNTLESKKTLKEKNSSVLLKIQFTTILKMCVSLAFDGQDYENTLQLENFGYLFQVKRLRCRKMTKDRTEFSLLLIDSFGSIFLLEFQV